MKKLALIFLCVINLSILDAQGLMDGFFKGKGKTDLAISLGNQNSSIYFAGRNPIEYDRNITMIGIFGEYGITERWDVIGNLPLLNFKPQDFSIGTKYELVRATSSSGVFSLIPGVGFSFPMTNYNTESGQAIGQRATQIMPKLILQYKHDSGYFLQGQGGYNYAFDPVPSSYIYSVKFGTSINKLYADVWYEGLVGLGSIDYKGSIPYSSFREFTVSYNRIGGVVYYQLKDRLGAFINSSYTLDGRNTGRVFSLAAGAVIKFGQ